MNGIFTMNVDVPFDRNNPRTYPERLNVRVPGPVDFLMKGHFIGMFAQDHWKLNNNLTINYGARYDIEILPTPNQDNPLFADDPDGYPMDLNNIVAASRLRVVARRGRQVGGPRRRRRVLPAHGVHVPDQHVLGRPVLGFVHRELPDQQHRSRSAAGQLCRPIRSCSTARSSIARCSTRNSRRARASATAARCASTTPIASTPIRAPTASATSVRSARRWVSRWTSSAPSSGISTC